MNEKALVTIPKIEHALQQGNITEQVLAKLNEHLALKVKDPNDKTGFELVKKARIECKSLRVLASKIAKAGREDAVAEQRAWLDAEKRVVGQISEIEAYLEGQENIVLEAKKKQEDEAKAREEQDRLDKERRARERFEMRANALMKVGVFKSVQEIASMIDSDFDILLKESTEKFEGAQKLKKQEDEARAKKKKELDEREAKQKADQKKIDDEKRKIEIENAKREGEEKARKEEKERQECEKKEAEDKKKRDADEQAKLEALKPDKEKMKALAVKIYELKMPELATPEAKLIIKQAQKFLESAAQLLNQ